MSDQSPTKKSVPNPTKRKPYQAPTLVSYGDAVEQTRGGIMGGATEYWGWRWFHIP